ncbi:hypothetical protein OSB04_007523 [Centaurea solstitialis]|uniref:Uncharacterized protein n=1 Tax=Centaurea solstitialis TaxID=347529 RepID=A0AA38TK15_9ASTR|nr:hypothetical protein OSB04_007523 [Centaurea solstitialis]
MVISSSDGKRAEALSHLGADRFLIFIKNGVGDAAAAAGRAYGPTPDIRPELGSKGERISDHDYGGGGGRQVPWFSYLYILGEIDLTRLFDEKRPKCSANQSKSRKQSKSSPTVQDITTEYPFVSPLRGTTSKWLLGVLKRQVGVLKGQVAHVAHVKE